MEGHILIRYGELSLKKSNRKQFTIKIQNHIKRALKKFKDLSFESRGMRYYIMLNNEDSQPIIEILKKIPGIYSFSVVSRCNSNLDDIYLLAQELVQKELNNGKKTFKIETNRADKSFPLTSIEITKSVGSYLFKNIKGLKADVHQPEFILYLDLRSEGTFIFTNIYLGLGGFPAGSIGKTLLMISGGIDSVVAGYLAIKKGMSVDAIHFAAPPYTSPLAVQKVIDLLETIVPYTEYQNINLYVVPFTDIQKAIYDFTKEDYCITIMRRMMYRISEKLARKIGALAIINGENIGQVASQTLESIDTIESVVKIPIIRPLAIFDKQDIINIATKIKTYDISILPYEDCCTVFVPRHPQIKPNLNYTIVEENKINFEDMIVKALNDSKKIVLRINQHYNYLKNKLDKDKQIDIEELF